MPAPLTMPEVNQTRREWKRVRPWSDNVVTNPDFARHIVEYFDPSGFCLDPCRGEGAFFNALPKPKDWCEIREGRDFLTYTRPVDWIITNPPWSGRAYGPISRQAFKLAEHVVFLVRLQNGLSTYRRHIDFLRVDHRLKDIILVDWSDAGFPTEGFALAVCHWERGYRSGTRWGYGFADGAVA